MKIIIVNTGFLWACILNNVDIFDILIEDRVNVNHRNKQNKSGNKILSHETKMKLKNVLQSLKKNNMQIQLISFSHIQ